MKAERGKQDTGKVAVDGPELLSLARWRTTQELGLISSGHAPSYAAAIAGNTPCAVLPNGMTIVMRKCSNWGC